MYQVHQVNMEEDKVTIEDIDNFTEEQDSNATELLVSNDKEVVQLGLSVLQLQERWNSIFEEFLNVFQANPTYTIPDVIYEIGHHYNGKLLYLYKQKSDLGDYQASKIVVRQRCKEQLLEKFFQTEESICEAELENQQDIFYNYKNEEDGLEN